MAYCMSPAWVFVSWSVTDNSNNSTWTDRMQKTASKQYMFMYSGIHEERSPCKSWKVVLEVVFGEGFFYVQRWTEGFAETWYSKLMMLKAFFCFVFVWNSENGCSLMKVVFRGWVMNKHFAQHIQNTLQWHHRHCFSTFGMEIDLRWCRKKILGVCMLSF